MSARQQAAQLKTILVKNFKKSRIREAMVQTLESKGQIASGNLKDTILRSSDFNLTTVNYKIDSNLDAIYDVRITYRLDLSDAPYARAVDTVEGRDSSGLSPSISAIEQWISQKLSNGTWRGGNMYIIRRKGKNYSYSLNDFRYRRRLAFVIARSIKDRGYLKTRSPYLTEGKLRYELAMLDSINEFMVIWEDDVALAVSDKLISLF